MDIKDQLVFVRAKLDLTQQVLAQKLNVFIFNTESLGDRENNPDQKSAICFPRILQKKQYCF